jgi:hypothetical protein
MAAGATALAAITASLAVATPAMAVPGLIVTIDWSDESGSEEPKAAMATCPAGTVVLGGGGDIVNGTGEVRLLSLIPFDNGASPDTFYAYASEDYDGYAGNWSLVAWAIRGSGVSGWQKVSNTSTSNGPADIFGLSATCPNGKKVIGAGANILGFVNYNFLDGIQPASNLSTVWVEAAQEEAFELPIQVTAHAICINPIPGQQLVSASTTSTSSSGKYISVTCPAGTKLHGTGASLSGAVGEVYLNRVGLIGAGAVAGADIEAYEDETGAAANWQATAYAICAV